jgi:3-oxoacyl-[acyl-carrier protein] reductase
MIKNDFENQVAIVTGGADGLGKAIASKLGLQGVAIALFDINPTQLQSTTESLLAQGIKVRSFVVDVANEKEIIDDDMVCNKQLNNGS